MKKQICIFLCTLMILSIPVASGFRANNVLKDTEITAVDDDVPVWEVGDSWNYVIDTLSFQLLNSGVLIGLTLNMNDLSVEVTDATAPSYKLQLSGFIGGLFEYDDGDGTVFKGSLLFTKLTGDAKLRQADLAIEEGHFVIKGIALLTEHPFQINFRIPIPMTVTLNFIQDAPRPLIDFPLSDGKEGLIIEASVSANIKFESIFLRILNILNSDIPKELYLEQPVSFPVVNYTAVSEEITVEAGTFTAYNIGYFGGLLGSVYYAPAAGNIAKVEAEFEVPDQINAAFSGQLKSYSYE